MLDLVALGTVADVVKLDDNNRILVEQGLQRIRSGKTWPGIAALLHIGGREAARASTYDLGFVVGPRLNAAGRLDDMAVGIECLITNDHGTAERIARQLDELNRQRRAIEADMHENALASLASIAPQDGYSLSMFDPDWHQGVIGIVASRLKERYHRPVIAFARGIDGEIKGSGRSISALHFPRHRSTSSPNASPASSCVSAATPPPPDSRCAKAGSCSSVLRSKRSPKRCCRRRTCAR